MTPPPPAAPPAAPSNRRLSQRGAIGPWVWILAVALAAGGGWWWWKSRAEPAAAGAAQGAAGGPGGATGANRRFAPANRTQPVSVQAAERRDIHVVVNAIGSMTASNTAVVRAQVSGVLQALRFKEGQQVSAGQVLAQIDPRAFQAALGQAEGTLARDRAQLENARIDLARYRDLLAKDAIAKQQLDTQEALVRQLEGTVRTDQASVDNARLQLSYTRVVAPISGRVGLKQADLGNLVQAGDTNGLVTITQTRPIALLFALPSANLPQIAAKLRVGQPLVVEAWDRGGTQRLAVGKLATIDNAIDASTDTIKAKAEFANENDALFPNQAVSVRLALDTLSDTLAVPQAAVLRGAQGFYVYVVGADNAVATRAIKTGPIDGDWMAVSGAVQAGDQIVIDGVDRLRDGAKVEVIAADPKQRAGANAAAGGRRGPRGDAASAPADGASRPSRRASAPEGGAAASGPAGGSASATADSGSERPAWLDRLPPEVADKVMKMSPDERREWIRQRREERARREAAGQ